MGVRRVVLARGELDKLEGPKICREQGRVAPKGGRSCESKGSAGGGGVAGRGRRHESDATEEEATGGRTTRVGRTRGGMKVAARIGERLRREIGRGGRPRVGDG